MYFKVGIRKIVNLSIYLLALLHINIIIKFCKFFFKISLYHLIIIIYYYLQKCYKCLSCSTIATKTNQIRAKNKDFQSETKYYYLIHCEDSKVSICKNLKKNGYKYRVNLFFSNNPRYGSTEIIVNLDY